MQEPSPLNKARLSREGKMHMVTHRSVAEFTTVANCHASTSAGPER